MEVIEDLAFFECKCKKVRGVFDLTSHPFRGLSVIRYRAFFKVLELVPEVAQLNLEIRIAGKHKYIIQGQVSMRYFECMQSVQRFKNFVAVLVYLRDS